MMQTPSEFLATSDVARIAVERGDPITPATVRVAASAGRLRTAAMTPKGQRLFSPADVNAYLAARAAHRGTRG